jgi:hypothetical protein
MIGQIRPNPETAGLIASAAFPRRLSRLKTNGPAKWWEFRSSLIKAIRAVPAIVTKLTFAWRSLRAPAFGPRVQKRPDGAIAGAGKVALGRAFGQCVERFLDRSERPLSLCAR